MSPSQLSTMSFNGNLSSKDKDYLKTNNPDLYAQYAQQEQQEISLQKTNRNNTEDLTTTYFNQQRDNLNNFIAQQSNRPVAEMYKSMLNTPEIVNAKAQVTEKSKEIQEVDRKIDWIEDDVRKEFPDATESFVQAEKTKRSKSFLKERDILFDDYTIAKQEVADLSDEAKQVFSLTMQEQERIDNINRQWFQMRSSIDKQQFDSNFALYQQQVQTQLQERERQIQRQEELEDFQMEKQFQMQVRQMDYQEKMDVMNMDFDQSVRMLQYKSQLDNITGVNNKFFEQDWRVVIMDPNWRPVSEYNFWQPNIPWLWSQGTTWTSPERVWGWPWAINGYPVWVQPEESEEFVTIDLDYPKWKTRPVTFHSQMAYAFEQANEEYKRDKWY